MKKTIQKNRKSINLITEARLWMAMELFDFLNKQNIPYVVLGDTRDYHIEIISDIDIIVDVNSFAKIRTLFSEFAYLKKIDMVQIIEYEQYSAYITISWRDKDNSLNFLHPDICSNYYRFGSFFLSSKEMLADPCFIVTDIKNNKGFFLPSSAMAFIYYLIKKIDKASLNKSQAAYLSSQWEKNPDGAMQQVKRFWDDHEAKIINNAAAHNDWENISAKLPELRNRLRSRLTFFFLVWLREIIRKIKRLLQPTGLFVIFLGSDGSGKTTVISKVKNDLAPAFRNTKLYHLRPYFGFHKKNVGNAFNPHGQKPRGIFLSIAKLGLWWIDYIYSYLTSIYLQLAKSTFVIFDRYYYDLLVDPKRYRYKGPMFIARLINAFVPRPNLIILLDAPANVLHSRKQEVSFEESIRQQKAYLNLLSKIPNGHVINASRSLEEVVIEVENVILNFMIKRTKLRYNLKLNPK